MQPKVKSIDDYIALQPQEVRPVLEKLRFAIHKAAPKAEEVISYNMPGFKQNGIVIWFAGAKNHYGIYPYPKTIDAFKKELKGYDLSKGTIRFPYDKPVPVKLITAIVKHNVKRNEERVKVKVKGKSVKKKRTK
jgi:uncharacterized protein YdhG (YjbR/CyaY superfamily)